MHRYIFEFKGRKIHAIGIFEEFTNIEVHADNEKDAIMQLYKNYEHISLKSCVVAYYIIA